MFSDPVEAVIARLCPLFSRQADELLDIRDSLRQRIRPGLCVSCYFKLSGGSDAASQTSLLPLRAFLESNIEVVARDGASIVLEHLPLKLDLPDLESYCNRTIDEFRENRVYSTDLLTLEFRYKEAA